MSWIKRLEHRLEPYAITNISLFIVIGQVFVLLTGMLSLIDLNLLVLDPSRVKAGEWWRLASFIFLPVGSRPVFIAFAVYMFYLYGSALEHFWGALRLNLFLFSGWVLTAALAFFAPGYETTNYFLFVSVGLCFAWINPNFEIVLFFVLPVKVKWLALIGWLNFAYEFFVGGLSTKLAIGAATANFLLFFATDIARSVSQRGRRGQTERLGRTSENTATAARHTCSVCQRTEVTNPELDFRYASDDQCYCSDHLPNRKPALPAGNSSDSSAS